MKEKYKIIEIMVRYVSNALVVHKTNKLIIGNELGKEDYVLTFTRGTPS